jgi:hypothetical protein
VEKVSLSSELALELLTQRLGVLRHLALYLLSQGVELLRQPLFPSVQLCLQIAPRGLLGPESEDAQQRRGQGSLLILRKPCCTQLLHDYLCVAGDRRRLSFVYPLQDF